MTTTSILDFPTRRTRALTERHLTILRVMGEYANEHGYPPTLREVGDKAGISSSSVVQYNQKQLEANGYIDRDEVKSRGATLTDKGWHECGLHPTYGHVEPETRRAFAPGDAAHLKSSIAALLAEHGVTGVDVVVQAQGDGTVYVACYPK